jgi:hypothetical protein
MPPWFLGEFVNGLIPFVGGVYATLLAFRVIGPKPGAKPKMDDWHRRWGGFMLVGGPLLVVFAVFLWAKGFIYHSGSNPPPANVWVRHNTSDGTASVEFPAPPTVATKEAEGVVNHNVTLSQKDRDRHFILSWSEIAPVDGVSDEERLDGLREGIPAMTAKLGTPVTFLSEEPYSENGCSGRVFLFDGKGKYLQRMKCLIVRGRLYRATATTPRNPQDEADGVRFVSSFRLEKDVVTR